MGTEGYAHRRDSNSDHRNRRGGDNRAVRRAYLLAEGISHRLRGQRDCKNSQHELIYYILCFAEMYIRTVYLLNLISVI